VECVTNSDLHGIISDMHNEMTPSDPIIDLSVRLSWWRVEILP
jgi:hypothetical protein